MILGHRQDDTFYLVEIIRRAKRHTLDLLYYDGKVLHSLQARDVPLPNVRDRVELVVGADARGVQARLADVVLRAPAPLPRPTEGGLGFFISGDTAWPAPITIEALRIEKL